MFGLISSRTAEMMHKKQRETGQPMQPNTLGAPKSLARRLRTILGLALFVFLAASCGSDSSNVVELEGTLDGQSIGEATPSNPIALRPFQESDLIVDITNTSNAPVTVEHLRIEGEMLDLTFMAYDAGIDFSIEPGETRQYQVPVDFFDLDRQAHGYLRTSLKAYDGDRTELGSTGFAVDVRGRPFSLMGTFAGLLALMTAASIGMALWAASRRKLPANRLVRAFRFAVPGLGVGLLLTVAFSMLRIFPLPTTAWVPMVAIPTAIGFVLGYLSPAPDNDPFADLTEDEIDELIDLRTGARTQAVQASR